METVPQPPFEMIDLAGDAAVRSYGRTLTEAFESAGLALSSLLVESRNPAAGTERTIICDADNYGSLLIAYLNELIFLFETEDFAATSVRIRGLGDETGLQAGEGGGYRMEAVVSGYLFNPELDTGGTIVKAATYHRLRIDQKGKLWEIDVVFDT